MTNCAVDEGYVFCEACKCNHVTTEKQCLLRKYRRIMDSIHALGSIYYGDAGRMHAYNMFANLAAIERRAV